MNRIVTRFIVGVLFVFISAALVEAGCNKFKYCPNCKYELKPEWNKCPNCGANLCDETSDSTLNIMRCDSLLNLKNHYLQRTKAFKAFRSSGIAMSIVGPAVICGAILYFTSGRHSQNESDIGMEIGFVGCVATIASVPLLIIGTKHINENKRLFKSAKVCLTMRHGAGLRLEATY